MGKLSRVLVSIIVLLILLSLSTFTVDQREFALVFRLGEIVSVKKEPGLYFKTPIVENVKFFDKRILTYESDQPDRFITSEKKNVLVDSYIKWRIMDPSKYYVSVNGDERQAERRITQTVMMVFVLNLVKEQFKRLYLVKGQRLWVSCKKELIVSLDS